MYISGIFCTYCFLYFFVREDGDLIPSGASLSPLHFRVEGEVIGCGIRGFEGRSVFFTQNGRLVGDVYRLPVRVSPLSPPPGRGSSFSDGNRGTPPNDRVGARL